MPELINIINYGTLLTFYKGEHAIQPGTICHLAVGPGQIRDDLQFIIADDFGVKFLSPEKDWRHNVENFSWGDIREFWPLETLWLLSEEVDTKVLHRLYRTRIAARDAILEQADKDWPKEKDTHHDRVLRWEERRYTFLRLGYCDIRPVRVFP